MRPHKTRSLRLESLERRALMTATPIDFGFSSFAPISDDASSELIGGEDSGSDLGWMAPAATHHDPYLPNFATLSPLDGGTRRLPTGNGNWSSLLPNVSPNDIVVVQGHVVLDVDADVHTILVASGGSLQFATNRDLQLRVVNLQVLSGGRLTIGTQAAPVTGNIDIVFKDVAIDATRDPGQHGNGLIVQGAITMHGRRLEDTFARLSSQVAVGASVLNAGGDLSGWQPGDRLLFPDSKQIFYTDNTSSKLWRYEQLRISEISGGQIALDATTKYDHFGARDADGDLVFTPHIANLSRNIVLRSENPAGTRGHTMLIGRADADIRYVEFRDMGRTTNGKLDNSVFDSSGNLVHFGTNQVARYPLHLHHLIGTTVGQSNGYQSTFIGNSINATENKEHFRWGVVLHGSHYSLVSENVVYNYAGAGIATEDGSESFNMIADNFVSRVNGTRARGKTSDGREGNGIWLRRANNYLVNNVVTGAEKAAYAVYGGDNHAQPPEKIPAFRGANPHMGQYTLLAPESMHMLGFEGNEAYASHMGVEIWYLGFHNYYNPTKTSVEVSEFNSTKLWHINHTAIFGEQANRFHFNDTTIVGDKPALTEYNVNVGVNLMRAVETTFSNLKVDNYHIGVETPIRTAALGATQQLYEVPKLIFEGGLLRNWRNLVVQTPMEDASYDAPPKHIIIRNVRFTEDPNSTGSRRNIVMNYRSGRFSNLIQQDVVEVIGYNGKPGDDFRLYYNQQHADFIVPQTDSLASEGPNSPIGAPVAGLTNAQAWQQYGIAIAGSVAPSSTPLSFPGLIGMAYPLGRQLFPPTIDAITPDSGQTGDFITSAQQISLSGKSAPASLVSVFHNGTLLGSAVAGEDGRWLLSNSGWSLEPGQHTFHATAKSEDLTSDPSAQVQISVFTHAPTVQDASITLKEDLAVGQLFGTVLFGDADQHDRVQLAITAANADGLFHLDSTTGQLTLSRDLSDGSYRGTYDLTITATDLAGLSSSAQVGITVSAQSDFAWVQSLHYSEFPRLTAVEIVHLTPQQMATIPNRDWFVKIPAESRAALTQTQVRALNIAPLGMITGLTFNQRLMLTDQQIQTLGGGSLGYIDFGRVPADRINALTPSQLATIPNADGFSRISAEARSRLSGVQVRGLNIAPLGMINLLTSSQIMELTDQQLRTLGGGSLGYLDYSRVPTSRIGALTPTQLSAIPDRHGFFRLSAETRAALSPDQVRGLRIGAEGMINGLTEWQILELTDQQLQSLGSGTYGYLDLARVPLSRLTALTPAQFGLIPSLDGFLRLSVDVRSALSVQQVQGLNVRSAGLISALTSTQVDQLSEAQVHSLTYVDFRYLTTTQVVKLTREQLLTIPTYEDFLTLSSEARQALEGIGVRWVIGVGIVFD